MHPNSASADRRRVQVRRCTEFWPLPTGTPTPPEISVPFVLFVLFVSASQYYFVEYQYEHGRGPSAGGRLPPRRTPPSCSTRSEPLRAPNSDAIRALTLPAATEWRRGVLGIVL